MPLIRVENLIKHYRVSDKKPGLRHAVRHFFKRQYRTVEAVRGVDFVIEPGEVVGFLGPNGAGKTTALKMLSGLIHPTDGLCQVSGFTPFQRRPEFLRMITLVMGQKQQLIWDLPAHDSIQINAAVYEIPDSVAEQRTWKLAEMLDMTENLSRPVRKLSLGERMKAELIAALLHHPKVLFLDEPTLGLDVNAQVIVRQFVREFCHDTGATALLTSHYMADITALCERVLIIDKGALKYDGSLSGITEQMAPYREVKIELAQPPETGATFERYGEVESSEGREVRLLVQRDALPATVHQLMTDFEVVDLEVTDPPIEEVIGRVFSEQGSRL